MNIVSWLFLLSLSLMTTLSKAALVESGHCNLSQLSFDSAQRSIKLNGHWYFAKNRFLKPADYQVYLNSPSQDQLVPVPTLASDIADSSYGTYFCQLDLPVTQDALGVSISHMLGASRVLLINASQNQEFILLTSGKTASERENQVLGIKRQVGLIPATRPLEDKLFLAIEVSNMPRAAILSDGPVFGAYFSIWEAIVRNNYESFFVIGMLTLLCLVNGLIFIQRPEDKASLCIALFALLSALRQTSTEGIASILAPESWHGFLSLMSLNIALSAIQTLLLIFVSFLRANFPQEFPRRLVLGLWAWNAMASIVYFIFELNSLWVLLFGTLILATIVAIFWGLRRSIFQKRRGSFLALVGIVILSSGFIYDTTVYISQLEWPYLAHYGFIVFIVVQSSIVGKNFSFAFRTAERLSRDLTLEVEKQTRNIKLILRNIREGIFTIVPGQRLGAEYSDHMTEIIETQDIAQQDISQLLLSRSNLNNDDRAKITSSLDFCLGEASLNFTLNADSFAEEFVFHANSGDKVLRAEWAPVVNEKTDITEQVLVTLRDITNIKTLEAQAKESANTIRIITEIIDISSEKFTNFVKSCRNFIDENRRLLNGTKDFDAEVLKILFINMHTMKGAARSYRLKSMTEAMHNVEQTYAQLQKTPSAWNSEKLLQDLETVDTSFIEYERVWRDKLGRTIDNNTFEIDMETLKKSILIVHEMQNISNFPSEFTPMVDSLRATFYELYYKKAESVFSMLFDEVPRLARDLGKENPHLTFNLKGLGLTQDGVDLIRNTFVHLIRNSMDHGLETSSERLESQKPGRGMLVLSSKKVDQRCLLDFSDDGRGLNLDHIRSIALSKALLSAEEARDRQKLAALIFQSGFSTSKKVNEISGRGMGMAAVKQYLEEAGGGITINFQSEKSAGFVPFSFYIYLPAEAFRFFDETEWNFLGEARKAA